MRLIFLFILLLSACTNAQINGCTDVQATNYDPNATNNDGSCMYAPTNVAPSLIGDLPAELPEASGALFVNGVLWSHNDSGSEAKLYAFDPQNGTIVKEVVLGSSQVDWEDISYEAPYFYVGEFGNNMGDRTDLMVLRFSEGLFTANFSDTIQADTIHFSYPDQVDFTPSSSHDFDCEAFFVRNATCHLFSKNRLTTTVKHYTFPSTPGTFLATLADSIILSGQITSADMDDDGHIILIGYEPPLYNAFAVLLWDYQSGAFFSGNKRYLDLGSVLDMGQQEGVCFSAIGQGYILSEAVSALNQQARYFQFDMTNVLGMNAGLTEAQIRNLPAPNPVDSILTVPMQDLHEEAPVLYSSDGKEVPLIIEYTGWSWILDLTTVSPGVYILMHHGELYPIQVR